jgi:hypothetical protein
VLLTESVNPRLSLIILGMWVALALSEPFQAAPMAGAPEGPTPDQQRQPPHRVEPPHKPVQPGTRIAVIFGLNLFTYGQYGYNTSVTMPDGPMLHYAGQQNAIGGAFFLGAALTPPAALRRLTVGFTVNAGGLDSWSHPVIPSGAVTPFSQSNLSAQIQRSAALNYGWRPSISPYVEHELGFLLASRVRVGYQYWHQPGTYQGSFPVDQSRSTWADYHVQLLHSSHLIRLSLNNHTSLDDDADTHSTPPKHRPGFLRQAGILVGTNQTFMVFIGVGPTWSF